MSFSLPVLNPRKAATAASPPRSVRLSLTDRCDLACVYCRPDRRDGYIDAEARLDLSAWIAMVDGLVRAGVRRVRLTGGEPLLHAQVVDVVERLAQLSLDDIALTTNATRLAALAIPLRRAGLKRLNISLDSLDEERFWRLTRGGSLRQVLAGVDAALAAGFDEIKLNAVILRGENDDELERLTLWCWERRITPRFLEVMAIGEGAKLADRVVSGAEMRAALAHVLVPGEARRETDRGPAKYVQSISDSTQRVGFITGTSDTYCAGCDRLRVASDGTLRPCLATDDGLSAAAEARSGDSAAIARAVREVWKMKPDGDAFKGCAEPSAAGLSIRAIGG